jgi:FkbM family methyltransferase
MSLLYYRLLFALAYSNKFPFVSFTRNAALLDSARHRLYNRRGMIQGDCEGCRIALDVRHGVDLLVWIGRYERELRAFLRSRVWEGATVVDAGAHIGVYALLFSRLVGPTGRVVAFEPDSSTADRLEANIERNDCTNVRVYRLALGERETRLALNVTTDPGYSSFGTPVRAATVERRQLVPVVPLDLFCEREGITRIDLLKIDVEGHEIPVLRGAARMVREGCIGAAVVEYNREAQIGSGFGPRELGTILSDGRWSLSIVTGKGLLEFYNDGSLAYAELFCTRAPGREL